jgi:cytochrome c oxidase subunit IV
MSIFLQIADTCPPDYTASHPRIQKHSINEYMKILTLLYVAGMLSKHLYVMKRIQRANKFPAVIKYMHHCIRKRIYKVFFNLLQQITHAPSLKPNLLTKDRIHE